MHNQSNYYQEGFIDSLTMFRKEEQPVYQEEFITGNYYQERVHQQSNYQQEGCITRNE